MSRSGIPPRSPAFWGTLLAIALASPAAAAAGWQTATAGGMQVDVYLPDAKSPVGSGRALLIALHGCTQTAATLKQSGNFEVAADEFGMVVALPTVPNGGVLAGCWDYYGPSHARTGRHDGPLLELASTLLGDPSLGLDADQVYIAGLSSGGGEAMVLGCLAPDVFAGVGIAAGPTVGTESSQIAIVSTTEAAAADLCRSLAGDAAPSFETQLASVIGGTNDFVVAKGYVDLNAAVFANVYQGDGAALTTSQLAVDALPGYQPSGQGELSADAEGPRVSKIQAAGMGHAWPAGSGPGSEMSFVAPSGVAYASYLGEFFSKGSRRVGGGTTTGAGGSGAGAGGGPSSAGAGASGDPANGGETDDTAGGCCSTSGRKAPGGSALVIAWAGIAAVLARRASRRA